MRVTRSIRIEWRPGEKVAGRLVVASPASGSPILLAHGAGAGQLHPFMVGLRRRLAAGAHTVLTFDYPYVEAGRKAPDRASKLLQCHAAAADRLVASVGDPIVLAGKSMGGRIGSHLAARGYPCRALVFFGYPLVSPSSGIPRNVDHLLEIASPMLFVTGSRDRLAPLDLLRPVLERLRRATLVVVDDGDHSFAVPKRSGRSQADVFDQIGAETVAWLGGL